MLITNRVIRGITFVALVATVVLAAMGVFISWLPLGIGIAAVLANVAWNKLRRA